jgi:hypothetical protein
MEVRKIKDVKRNAKKGKKKLMWNSKNLSQSVWLFIGKFKKSEKEEKRMYK